MGRVNLSEMPPRLARSSFSDGYFCELRVQVIGSGLWSDSFVAGNSNLKSYLCLFVCLFVDWIAPGPVALNLPRFRPSLALVPGRGGAPSPWPLWPSCAIFLNLKACWACKLARRGEPRSQWGPGPGLNGWDSGVMTGDQVKLKSVNIQTHFISCFIFCFAVLAAVPWKVNQDESHLSSSFVFT